MTLIYVDRTQYRVKTDPVFVDSLRDRFGDFYLIPEGGGNRYALQGCAEIPSEIDCPFDVLCCATGTGATLAGVASALGPAQRAIGFSVLKGGAFLEHDVARLQQDYGRITHNWFIETQFHFGGFARRNLALDEFVEDFRQRHSITLDWVYEGKMMCGLFTLLRRGEFAPGTTVIALLA